MKKLIFDKIRKRFVTLLPEEKVRQKMIFFLINKRNYPASLIRVERKISTGDNVRRLRTDIIVFEGRTMKPLILVECKAERIKITNSVIEQVMGYNSLVGAEYVVITNGIQTLCLKNKKNKYETSQIPFYKEVCI